MEEDTTFLFRVSVLFIGIALLLTISSSQWVDRQLSKVISALLKKYTTLDIKDYASLLHLAGEYSIHELYLHENDWIAQWTAGA